MLRYRLFRRNTGLYFIEDRHTRRQESLRTRNREIASRLFHAKNEAHQQPALNLQIARAYLMASDPAVATRTWQHVMDEMARTKHGETKARWIRATKDKAFDLIRDLKILETHAERLIRVLETGAVATNVFLRRLHNFALDMNWLPCPVIPKKQWPRVRFKEKRAITFEEHRKIVEREINSERRGFYELCWHLGGSQTDIVSLHAEDIDWPARTIAYARRKTASPAVIHLGDEVERTLLGLPQVGPLFPNFGRLNANHRATEFARACRRASVEGVTLHSYRYAWAERAKIAGYPERFAQEALGHNSKAVHRAYAKKAQVKLPSLEEYEKLHVERKVIRMPTQDASTDSTTEGLLIASTHSARPTTVLGTGEVSGNTTPLHSL